MSKLTRKEKFAQQKERGTVSPKEIKKQEIQQFSVQRWLGFLLAILAFAVYTTSLNNDYVLDDYGLIHDNTQVKQGYKAIPEIFKSTYRFGMNIVDHELYRPLSKAMFAAEWSIAPNNPHLGHWVNVILFAICAFVLFRVLCRYFEGQMIIPFLTVMLFTVHPIHAEVVANIKSRDEILAFLFCLLSAGMFHRWIYNSKTTSLVLACFFYFVALFAKESAITFLLIFPLMFYFFTPAEKKHYINAEIPLLLLTGIFLLIRRKILGPFSGSVPIIDNFIAGQDGFIAQRVNAIYMLGYYLKTILFPNILISDGSYNHFKAVTITDWKFLVSAVVFLGGMIYAILNFRKKEISSFAILFFFISVSVVSNVFLIIGTCYGERLMFVPSVGICMLIAILIVRILKSEMTQRTFSSITAFFNSYKPAVAVAGVLALPLAFQAYSRSNEWKDNLTLYTTDLKKVPDSAHMLFYLANHITTEDFFATLPDSAAIRERQKEGIGYLDRAVEIYPEYGEGFQRRAYIYSQMRIDSLSERDYLKSLELNPTNPVTNNNYGHFLFNKNRFDEALKCFETAVRYNPNYAHALNNLASSYGVYGNGEEEAAKSDPAKAAEHKAKAAELFQKAIFYFNESIRADPEFGEPYRLAAMTYRFMGETQLADKYDATYKEVMKNNRNAKN